MVELICKEECKLNVFMNAYQVLRNNIEFYKRQQWQISYYGIAVNAALSYFYLDKSGTYLKIASPIIILGFVASAVCIAIIIRLECSILSELKSVRRVENTIPLLKSITNKKYTTMNVKMNVKNDKFIFYTTKSSQFRNDHSVFILALSIITVIFSFVFLVWITELQKIK